jgi:hypothetical protein
MRVAEKHFECDAKKKPENSVKHNSCDLLLTNLNRTYGVVKLLTEDKEKQCADFCN